MAELCKNCGCKEDLSVLNIRYDGNELSCISIEEGDNLQAIFNNINDIICTLKDNLISGINVTNIGTGSKVYKGKNQDGVNELRTFLAGAGIDVTENENEITISSIPQTTDLSFDVNTNTISATFTDGTQRTAVLDFDETLTSISQDEVAGTITYIDEEGNPTVLNVGQSSNETLTSLIKQSGDLVYIDENSDANIVELPKNTSDLVNDGDGNNDFITETSNISLLTNDAGYLDSYTETDPVFTTHPSFNITAQNISDWEAKVSNATHTGDVTGSTALTITDDIVSNTKLADMPINTIKGTDVGGDPKDLTAGQVKTIIGLDFGVPASDGQVLQGNTNGTFSWTTIAGSTLDLIPTDGSTNGVESNGIFDALADKAGLSIANNFTAQNTFTGSNPLTVNNTSGSGIIITPQTNNSFTSTDGAIWFDIDKGLNIGQGNGSDIIKFTNSNSGKRTYNWPNKSGTVALLDDIVSGSSANLSYVASATNGVISNTGGTDATIPLSTTLNAGLMSPSDKTKISNISVSQPVNLDTLESDVNLNNAKVSNATHTGEVTGSTTLTISNGAVTNNKIADNTIVASSKLTNSGVSAGTYNTVTVNNKGIVTSATNTSVTDASTLDGIDSSQFLRSDISDTANGQITFASSSGTPIRLNGSSSGNSNINFVPFYQSNGTTRQGFVGFASSGNSSLIIGNDVSQSTLILDDNGTLTFNRNIFANNNQNVLQSLSISGSTLSISNGNSVTLPSGGGSSVSDSSGSTTAQAVAADSSLFVARTTNTGITWYKVGRTVTFTQSVIMIRKSFSGSTSFFPEGDFEINNLPFPVSTNMAISVNASEAGGIMVNAKAEMIASSNRILINVIQHGEVGATYAQQNVAYRISGTYLTT